LYTFITPYIVPAEALYRVQVIAYMECDSAWVNADHATDECADIHNILVDSVVNPGTQTGIAGATEYIVVSVKNESDNRRFDNVIIAAQVEDGNRQVINSFTGIVPTITANQSQQFTFTGTYIIPDDSVYYIRVYLNSSDVYPEDDTLTVERYAKPETGLTSLTENGFTLSQNIPNPVKNTTRINYSIPEAGQVVFHVHSVSGQLLYSQTIEAANGKQSLELNTTTFAAGIYFYSIEYKGQRLVKRMSVQK
jgi:hypothetical protein